jgi:REP element-mobilizing transposase RayT
MSRIIQRQMLLGDIEKEKLRQLMRAVESFCGVRILTYAILTNHFHLLLEVPRRESVSDAEFLRRIGTLYAKGTVREIREELEAYRADQEVERAEEWKAKYTYRMYDVSEFMKTLKQRFTQWYNRRNGRKGTLWEERFKSVLVEAPQRLGPLRSDRRPDHALVTMAAYIDLNPVRAGLADDPKQYRFCGYAEAVGGRQAARDGLATVLGTLDQPGNWRSVSRLYRQVLFAQGQQEETRRGFSPERVRQVLEEGGELTREELLRCRVRYFSDGMVLGSKAFVEEVFQMHRERFGPKRKTGARRLRGGDWAGLCTARDLRLQVIMASPG